MAEYRNYRDSKRKGRSLQRQRALDVLFEADTKDILESGLLDLLSQRRSISTAQQPIKEYGVKIVETYAKWADDVDSMIEAASPAWALNRMSAVDRNLLRIGATELMFLSVDVPVIVKEISGLARDFSTEKAISFTMGVLNRINEIRALETSGNGVREDLLIQDIRAEYQGETNNSSAAQIEAADSHALMELANNSDNID
ncbi:transcription antitermination protein NusB [Arcanobacterium hippocoleae]